MSSQNLCAVTIDLIETYGNTARNVITACRLAGERVNGLMDQSWDSAIARSAPSLGVEVRDNATAAQRKFSGYYAKGIAVTTNGAETVVSKVVSLADKGVQQIAANASRFEETTGVKALNQLAVAAVPAVLAVSRIANTIEEKTSLLAKRVAGKKTGAKAGGVKAAVSKRTSAFKQARARKAA